jgi:hypothetical protein
LEERAREDEVGGGGKEVDIREKEKGRENQRWRRDEERKREKEGKRGESIGFRSK